MKNYNKKGSNLLLFFVVVVALQSTIVNLSCGQLFEEITVILMMHLDDSANGEMVICDGILSHGVCQKNLFLVKFWVSSAKMRILRKMQLVKFGPHTSGVVVLTIGIFSHDHNET